MGKETMPIISDIPVFEISLPIDVPGPVFFLLERKKWLSPVRTKKHLIKLPIILDKKKNSLKARIHCIPVLYVYVRPHLEFCTSVCI
jgi:hypothetical protein